MSVITTLIPSQSFELIRDRLGLIIADELHNQSLLDNGNPDIDANVFVERLIPIDHSEMPLVNVMLAKGVYDSHTQTQSDGTYTYHLDFYTKAKSKNNEEGDKLAVLKLHRLIGIGRAIISDYRYNTLAFVPPFVMSVKVTEVNIADPGNQDSVSSCMGRLTVVVKAPEHSQLKEPVTIGNFHTQIKLVETDKGYFYAKPEE